MTASSRKIATYEDVLAAPENMIAQVLFGVLYTHPRPAAPHAIASSRIGTDLGGPFDRGRGGPGGWVILYEPELHLGADIVVPDLAGWRRERTVAADFAGAFITAPPDWICEVLSPGTEAIDRSDKMDIYAREAVKHAWLVDPVDKTLEVYALDGSRWTRVRVARGDATVRAEPFDAIELTLTSFWEV
jgi:Uma2 family endonuclease